MSEMDETEGTADLISVQMEQVEQLHIDIGLVYYNLKHNHKVPIDLEQEM